MEVENQNQYKALLIQSALEMLDSVETVIKTKEVDVTNPTTYQVETEEIMLATQSSTFKGEDREYIKKWLLEQLV